MADSNGTFLQELNGRERKRLTGPPLGTGFDALGDRLFQSFDDGRVFDYGTAEARDYSEMLDRDGKARAIEQALTLPLRSAPWEVHPGKGDTGEAEFVQAALEAMSTPMDLVIGQMTAAVTYRASFHEKQWRLDDQERVVYDKLAWRPPATCQLARDAKTAAFRGFRQRSWWVGTGFSAASRDGYVDIPPQRSFVYLHGQHRDPLKGTSDLEVSRWCHETRQKLLFIWYQFLEKQSLPWVLTYGASPEDAQDKAEQVATLKGGGVVGLPYPQEGQRAFDVLEASGQGADQFMRALQWLDQQMSMSVLAGWLDLTSSAAQGRGSFALSADQTELFMAARKAVLKEMAATIGKWLLEPLVVYNRGPKATVPAFKFGPIDEAGASETVTLLQAIAAAPKVNLPAAFVEELVVRAANLLDLDVDKIRRDAGEAAKRATEAAPTPQAAEVGKVAGPVHAVAKAVADQARAERGDGDPKGLAAQPQTIDLGEWRPELHPRGDDGRFIHSIDAVAEAAREYSENGATVNEMLREGRLGPDDDLWQEIVAPLDQVIDRSVLAEPKDVTRGATWAEFGTTDMESVEGHPIRNPGFLSTSDRRQPPGELGRRPILMRIHIPAGTHAFNLGPHSRHPFEHEVLLGRNTTIQVRRVYREGTQWIVEGDVDAGQ